jgi:diamine N-acetyltransferase
MLCSAHLRLRPLELSDSELIRTWRFDFNNYDSFYEFTPRSALAHDAWLRSALLNCDELNLIAEETQKGKPIGMIALLNIDNRSQKAEMGRVLLADCDYRGKGLGVEMIELLLAFAFQHLNMRRVYCEVFADNAAARHVYQKVGFEVEGILRQHIYKRGSFKDVMVLGALRPSW